MKKHLLIKAVLLFISFFMIGVAVWTSLQSNLWLEGPRLLREPWMAATLIDFYFNIFIISLWVVYRESSPLKSAAWVVSFVALGSISTAYYVFLQLYQLKPEESLDRLWVRKK